MQSWRADFGVVLGWLDEGRRETTRAESDWKVTGAAQSAIERGSGGVGNSHPAGCSHIIKFPPGYRARRDLRISTAVRVCVFLP